MSEDEALLQCMRVIVRVGRSPELASRMASDMSRRERSRGVELCGKWVALEEEVLQWLSEVGERMLQDQASAET